MLEWVVLAGGVLESSEIAAVVFILLIFTKANIVPLH